MKRDLPSGTVTFLFTDVEGSTRLLHELGAEAYDAALIQHRRALREAFARHGGVEVDTQGDAFFYAFPTAEGALLAAGEGQAALAQGPISVRMGLHTGLPHIGQEGYIGDDVHFAARVAASSHGGQVVLSRATAELVELPLTDLGEHRLKDIEGSVPIFQLGDGRFPPLKTISNTNLPRPASSFVGRDKEVEEVASLLQDGIRLLTLTGPGGSGKTRLAIEASAELVPQFKSGVFWVGLASLRDPALVTEAIAQTLGARDGLVEHISERELLLLLDNLEQVVDAAPELASLVEACPNLRLLVTSRELLRVRGEVEYPVPPLAETEAVALFCQRARLEPDGTIAELCRRLDNLPLAVELAAARTSVLSPARILERLSQRLDLLKGGRDAEARQQTLRATIEWSYQLLSGAEQRTFARLSVFAGGCTLEAAGQVAEAGLDTLQSLVDKSLLRHTEERYWLLETIREYATERLEASGEAQALRKRHAEFFLASAEGADANYSGGSKEWMDRLEREHDNFRAAIDRLSSTRETQLVLLLCGSLWRLWSLRGHYGEGRRRLESALRADDRPTAARAKALSGMAAMSFEVGDFRARPSAEEALAIYRELGDEWGIANTTFMLGSALIEEGELERARQALEQSVERFRALGDDHYTMLSTSHLAWALEDLGDLERGKALHEENLERARYRSNRRIEAMSLGMLWWHAHEEGLLEEALSLARQSLVICKELDLPPDLADQLTRIAATYAKAGRAVSAARLLSRTVSLLEELGGAQHHTLRRTEATLATLHEQLDEAAFAEVWNLGAKLTLDEAVALALGNDEFDV